VDSGPAQGPAPRRQPADFVLLVDNSASITSAEQALVREVSMLLADMADPGDSVSVISFGNDARLVVAVTITGDQDRVAFKQAVSQALRFRDTRSDIRKGLRVLADNRRTLFHDGATPVAILLSDGKLEPAEGTFEQAFAELKSLMAGPLAQTGITAVALGDTTARDQLFPELNGLLLMEQYIARSHTRFYRARSLDELLPVTVAILSRAKGLNSIGEPGKTVFKIDRSVESAMFIVRKKSTDGRTLCASGDIRLQRSQPAPGAVAAADQQSAVGLGGSLYWATDYQYFDLIVVRQPLEGLWEVTLANGGKPEVLSKVVPGIELRVTARDRYWINERAVLAAYLVERATGAASSAGYKVQARIAPEGGLASSDTYLTMRAASEPGQYLIEVPSGLGRLPEAGAVELEIVAEQFKAPGSQELDPWFIRRSAPIKLELAAPFIQWKPVDAQYTRIPLWTRHLDFGALLAPARGRSSDPVFETPPRLTVTLERFDSGRKVWAGAQEATLDPLDGGSRYAWSIALPESGDYRYRFRVQGSTLNGGPLAIESAWLPLRVRFPWPEIGGALLLLLVVVSGALARVQGSVRLALENGITDQCLVNEGEFSSVRFSDLDPAELGFRVAAHRRLFFFKSMRLRVDAGALQVEGGTTLRAGRTYKLQPGRIWHLTGTLAAGKAAIELELSV